jgi:hypothetical protein
MNIIDNSCVRTKKKMAEPPLPRKPGHPWVNTFQESPSTIAGVDFTVGALQ